MRIKTILFLICGFSLSLAAQSIERIVDNVDEKLDRIQKGNDSQIQEIVDDIDGVKKPVSKPIEEKKEVVAKEPKQEPKEEKKEEKKEEAPKPPTSDAITNAALANYNKENSGLTKKYQDDLKERNDDLMKKLQRYSVIYTKQQRLSTVEVILKIMDDLKKDRLDITAAASDKKLPNTIKEPLRDYRTSNNTQNNRYLISKKRLAERFIKQLDDRVKAVAMSGNAKLAVELNNFKEKISAEIMPEEEEEKSTTSSTTVARLPRGLRRGGLKTHYFIPYNAMNCKDIKIDRTRTANQIFISKKVEIPKIAKDKNKFALLFEGYLYADKSGEYYFDLESDDGAILYIRGKEVANNDGTHAKKSVKGSIVLPRGWHKIEIKYFDGGNQEELSLKYAFGKDNKYVEISEKHLAYRN